MRAPSAAEGLLLRSAARAHTRHALASSRDLADTIFPRMLEISTANASLVFLDPTCLALGTARSFLCYPFVISAVRSFHFYSGQALFFNRVCVSEKVTFLCDVNGGRKNLHLLCQEAQNIFLLSNYLDSLMDEIYLVLCWTTS